ncbi:hypothetical protein CH72_5709 [Burkholderia ambifaria AMMD]|uniref:hypothetical protein n=1 Tax=Burkholderia ambifaria TaxID=152480 RepID=UPI0005A11FC1|nr:hypothetical protein [Burkholderia ambifaria]AJY26092.1 hypothetical protein CH72_5709 [Burkholderia ambifaria AMMD]MBR7932429.1 hypothetical protein [Burkholderia ambifaria]QQC08478.1 hypothetical protein I6H84_31900 [Burkholderia ambifaria]UZU00402.1 hypothetical protein OR987_03450 [Burkholderia ambifaria]UZU06954.1 hypothetical protein OR988_03450 [Burkholderia ambifaria]
MVVDTASGPIAYCRPVATTCRIRAIAIGLHARRAPYSRLRQIPLHVTPPGRATTGVMPASAELASCDRFGNAGSIDMQCVSPIRCDMTFPSAAITVETNGQANHKKNAAQITDVHGAIQVSIRSMMT